jgi:hypothetical protein
MKNFFKQDPEIYGFIILGITITFLVIVQILDFINYYILN